MSFSSYLIYKLKLDFDVKTITGRKKNDTKHVKSYFQDDANYKTPIPEPPQSDAAPLTGDGRQWTTLIVRNEHQ